MYERRVIEKPEPLRLYFVEHNETGEREVCSLIRGAWNRIHAKGGLFFAYQNQAVAVSEAHPCGNCSQWCMYPMKFGEDNCCEICMQF